jgi:hypothetical protein
MPTANSPRGVSRQPRDASIVRLAEAGRLVCHALSRLAARGGRLHCPDDAHAERREDAALLLS